MANYFSQMKMNTKQNRFNNVHLKKNCKYNIGTLVAMRKVNKKTYRNAEEIRQDDLEAGEVSNV